MKLHLSTAAGQNMVTGYGDDHVLINSSRFEHSLVVLPDEILRDWPVTSLVQLSAEHFLAVLETKPELVLLGTGRQHRMPSPRLYASLLEHNIGVEVMDTGAACRTYNILTGEGRRVAAALFMI